MINRLLGLPSSSLRLVRIDKLAYLSRPYGDQQVWKLRQDVRAICEAFRSTLRIDSDLASRRWPTPNELPRNGGSLLFGPAQNHRDSFDPFGGPSSKRGAQSQKSENKQQEDEKEQEEKRNKFQRQAFIISTILGVIYAITSVNYYKQVKQLEEQITRERESRTNAPGVPADYQATQQPVQPYANEIDQLLAQGDTRKPMNASQSAEPAFNLNTKNGNMLTWHELRMLIARKRVLEVRTARKSDVAIVVVKPDTEPSASARPKYAFYFVQANYEDIERRLNKLQDELNMRPEERVPIVFKDADSLNSLISLILTGGMLFLFFRLGKFLFSKAQTMQQDRFSQFTKARFTTVDPHLKSGVPQVNFKDVAGLHEAKVEVKEFVDYLREPERFTKLGAKVPRGALLLGPPGCGKTLLAKAVANEANVPFFNIAGTEFIEVIGGVGAARVRDLFEQARKQSPAIIYIDEIDAIGRKRSDGGMSSTGGSGESDQTLNQLLVSMDGLESSSNVVVLASTNRSDILDKALLRPGRLDRHITIDLPAYDERIEILNVHMARLKLNFQGDERTQFVSQLSHLTPRFSGADLANICNESALLAARVGHDSIGKKDFYDALERVQAGAEKKSTTISVEDRRLIAFHECGKVIVSWFTPNSDLILKTSLLARTNVNSFSQYLPSDKKLFSKDDLFDQMCLQMGGRVSEGLVFNRYTTNSERDLKKLTQMAYTQIESLGMNDIVGHMSFPTRAEERTRGMTGEKPYSRKLRNVIDIEVAKLTAEAHKRTEKIIKDNLDKLHKLAEELLKRESLTFEEIIALIGEPVNKARFRNIQMNKPHV